MAHWDYILWVAIGPTGLALWRYAPRAFLMLVGGLTKDPQRSKQCAEMLRLQRKDAKDLPSYMLNERRRDNPPAESRAPRARKHRRGGGSHLPSSSAVGRIAS
jgi:hypothetical protein